ncbi:MAG: InlB B-repeat-containing protein, partial [Lachnospiraceae bacterium]|nr:InlB B-repeat-containing protein [Lachnospiraceae bacterium]
MEEKKKSQKGRVKKSRRHPIGQRLIAGLLCLCLSILSMPIDDYGNFVLAAQGKEIVMFPALPREVRTQTVTAGTSVDKLDLPDTLTVVCRLADTTYGELKQDSPKLEDPAELESTEGILSKETGAEPSDDLQEIPETEPVNEDNQDSVSEPEVPTEPEVPEEPVLPVEPELPDQNEEQPKPLENIGNLDQTETVTIQGVVWSSEPEYDCETEGTYVFTPDLPEGYVVTEGAGLPEILVTVTKDDKTKRNDEKDGEKEFKSAEEKMQLGEQAFEAQPEDKVSPSTPQCGVISEDTVWTEAGTLSNGTLTVNPGVTLTINDILTIDGSVIINGGGTIARGNASTYIDVPLGAELTLDDIVLDGKNIPADTSLLGINGTFTMNKGSKIQDCIVLDGNGGAISCAGTVILDGAVIQDCKSQLGRGGAIYLESINGLLRIKYAVIKDCSSEELGGAIFQERGPKVIIEDGIFQNNKTASDNVEEWTGGGFLCVCRATLEIYGGKFIGNSTPAHGGAIYHCGCQNTRTNIRGGYFEGNTCTHPRFKGSGAIYNSTQFVGETYMKLSGNVRFCGDGSSESGVDGVFLDYNEKAFRKIGISDTLRYPVTLYVAASEGRVIAEGVDDYEIMHNRDMKKIKFVDVGPSGKSWYAVLDTIKNDNSETIKNEVYLSEVQPQYGNFVYYINNGAEGTVADDNEYQIGDEAVVLSSGNLKYGDYTFVEWNTKPDGSGTGYQPGDKFTIEGDTDLYAIFAGKSEVSANFYSGGAGQFETKTIEILNPGAGDKQIEAPQLKAMDGWTPVGWDESRTGYTGGIKAGSQITLTQNKDYYGVYKKDVTLSYRAEGVNRVPSKQKKQCYSNVHEQISQKQGEFTIAEGPERDGYIFKGWNTSEDGTGTLYQGGDSLTSDVDVTLYAVYERALVANFYSGSAGKKEVKSVLLAEGVVSGTITAPDLLPIEGWEAVGWDDRTDQYLGETAPGSEITLTENVNYYGIYKRNITLSYMAEGVEGIPEAQTAECRANIHDKLTVSSVEFTVAAGVTRPGYTFTGWNTKEDGTGVTYQEGESLLAETDIKLYAMYQKVLTVDFYSGKAGQKEVKKAEIADGATSAVIRTPELKELELPELRELTGWEPVGWDSSPISYQGNIAAGSEITLTEDASFYGVYQKGVTLSYEAIGVEGAPQAETLNCYVNVHEEALTFPARFLVSPAVERPGCAFVGWNTKQDGTGDTYQEGDVIEAETDLTLYAIYQKTLTADFYSGGAGRKESKSVSIGADATSGSVT